MPAAGEQLPVATTESPNDVALADSSEGICYKIRAYIFKRDDDHAPRVRREYDLRSKPATHKGCDLAGGANRSRELSWIVRSRHC